jgi:hypothetical protein
LLVEKIDFHQHLKLIEIEIERRKGFEEEEQEKGVEARARRGIHHLGAKLKLGLEILGARGKRVRLHS